MDIREELKKIPVKKRYYFEYLYPDTRYKQNLEPMSRAKLHSFTNTKTLDTFKAWEKTEEFQQLKAIYYQNKVNQDFFKIYDTVSEKAKAGDEKAIKQFLVLKKELAAMSKNKAKEEPPEDGLML